MEAGSPISAPWLQQTFSIEGALHRAPLAVAGALCIWRHLFLRAAITYEEPEDPVKRLDFTRRATDISMDFGPRNLSGDEETWDLNEF